jgi:UDP-glucose 4-epimerase
MAAMLAAQGHQPIVFDNLSTGHNAAIADTPFAHGDLTDHELLINTLKDHSIEAVMDFAALIEVSGSVEEPLRYYENNLLTVHGLLGAMEAVGVERFVFSSTAAVYGMPEQVPITEGSPTEPINAYGEAKLAAERLCHHQSQTGRLRYASLRYFNAAGASHDGRLGEDHRPESHLIPLVIQAAMGKRSEIRIFGTDYPTPDGTCIRDYIHIDDLCRAHLAALKKLEEGPELICNLGNGKGYSVREVIETVKKVSGRDFRVAEAERRPGDAAILVSDAAKARSELGWQPQITELDRIVETAWKWHSQNPDGYPD